MDEIKRCPFCFKDEYLHVSTYVNKFYVICQNDGCDAQGPQKDTEKEAIESWNNATEHLDLPVERQMIKIRKYINGIFWMVDNCWPRAIQEGHINVGIIPAEDAHKFHEGLARHLRGEPKPKEKQSIRCTGVDLYNTSEDLFKFNAVIEDPDKVKFILGEKVDLHWEGDDA